MAHSHHGLLMPSPSFSVVFPGATQTGESITIPKSSLPTLTALAINSGDQLSAGLLLALRAYYQPSKRQADKDTSLVADEPAALIGVWPGYRADALQFFLFRDATAIGDLVADRVGSATPLSADPVLVGRGGGNQWLQIGVPVTIAGRGGGNQWPSVVPQLALSGRGGGDDQLWLTFGGDLIDLYWSAHTTEKDLTGDEIDWFVALDLSLIHISEPTRRS